MSDTVFMLKPDAYYKREEILELVGSKHPIVTYQEFEMSRELFFGLYSRYIDTPLDALFEYLSENACVVATCAISIDKLMKISGTNIDPSLCDVGTIRREYGLGYGVTRSGLSIIRNAIHRPKNVAESEEQLNIFRKHKLSV